MQDREHEPQVARDRSLSREQRLNPFLDAQVALVDVVVEGDHFVRELRVALFERVDRATQRTKDERSFLLQRRLEDVELFLERRSHPNRPVT